MEKRRLESTAESAADMVSAKLKERIIGQDDAIDAIGTAFDKARLRDERRPVAALMFLGPTGTGKTETAETLSDIMAVDKLHPAFIRIDCAQYAQGHEVAALVGSPPGYVGREQAPVFDPTIIEQPGSVILFDEIEKGHPKLHNYLLQIMEGRGVKLMGTGQTVNFSNSTVVLTSNVGAQEIDEMMTERKIGFGHHDTTKPQKIETIALRALKKQFAPEFINRLDAVVTYKSLDDEQLEEVLQAHINRSNIRYERIGNVRLETSPELRRAIIEGAELRREFNARPVLRNYERMVETGLSRLVSAQKVGGNIIHAEYEDGVVNFYEGAPIEFFGHYAIAEVIDDDYLDSICEDDEDLHNKD